MATSKKAATRTARKPTAKRKPAPKRAAPKSPAPDFAAAAQDTGRNVYLAGLGFYGKAYDQAQEQISSLQQRMEKRRKQADKLYKELVKRGEKLEKDAKGAMQDIELPRLDLEILTDRKKLEQQLHRAKARIAQFRKSAQSRVAA